MSLVVGVIGTLATAHADVHGSLRVEILPLELEPSRDTPLFGHDIARALDRYDSAAAAYQRRTGNQAPAIGLADLALSDTLYVIAPGIDLGAGANFLRLEAPIGLGGNLTAVGLGIYPLGLRRAIRNGMLYGIAGGSASWLDRSGSGDLGGLLVARTAVGLRFARYLAFEVGYSPITIGGDLNRDKLDNLTAADIGYLSHPRDLLAAGESNAVVDVSIGVTF